MKQVFLFILFVPLMYSTIGAQELIVKTDFDGEVVQGSVEKLIQFVKEGRQIRIGWALDFDKDGVADLNHYIDAKFITILNGHVFNQIDPIYAQAPNPKLPQVEIGNNDMKWTGIIGTNGLLLSRFIVPNINEQKDENYKKQLQLMSKINQETVETSWFVLN